MYVFHEDPGHGWLAVKRVELHRLGIAERITHFSYQRGGTVYLEEDHDASIFVEAKRAAGEPVEYRHSYRERTPIRSYESYRYIPELGQVPTA